MPNKIILILRVVVALLLMQTLRYKFTAHPNSVFIFTEVGLEPVGRITIGILELIAAILILIPKTVWAGALLTIGIISGAIFLHFTQLGIAVNDDGGTLFYMAVGLFIMGIVILFDQRNQIPFIGKKL